MKRNVRVGNAAIWCGAAGLAALTLIPAAASAQGATATFCVTGTASPNHPPFMYTLECDGAGSGGASIVGGAIPAGSTCNTIVDLAFVGPINELEQNQANGWTATQSGCCFTVSNPNCAPGTIVMTITTGTGPPCVVTPSGCTFNPTITLAPPTSVDGSTWGRVKAEYR